MFTEFTIFGLVFAHLLIFLISRWHPALIKPTRLWWLGSVAFGFMTGLPLAGLADSMLHGRRYASLDDFTLKAWVFVALFTACGAWSSHQAWQSPRGRFAGFALAWLLFLFSVFGFVLLSKIIHALRFR